MNGKIDIIRVAEFVFLILGFAFALWKGWVALSNKVNGYGKRVNKLEESCASYTTEIANMKHEQDTARKERDDIRETATAARTKTETLRQELADDRLAVMSTLHQNEKAASERDAILNEKLGRLDERLNVRAMVTQVVREIKDGEK